MSAVSSSHRTGQLGHCMPYTLTRCAFAAADRHRRACRGAELLEHVCSALDHLCQRSLPFAGKYSIHSGAQRGIGSTGVVQLGAVLGCWLHSDTCSCKSPPCKSVQATLAYVRQSISTSLLQDAVAIKVYIDPAGFSIEQMVYGRLATSSVGTAPAFCNNADCSASTPYGFVFPPFTVTKKAQPLSEWFEKFEADFVTSMQVRISFMAVIAPCVMCKSHVHTKSASCALRRCNSYIAWCGVSFVWIAAIKC
jgi:hypothetical protein